ncbi:circadian clock-controlled protein daywake-like [Harmonia axyridis]|uniref:circadian clock-controlled protein daywake-like n=1 Tax=Harmonia axyridis TaxID=115357 RepID=UPI001E275179|nr:circadian clock-controlled protein daywake-like [Harmonia axyridis]
MTFFKSLIAGCLLVFTLTRVEGVGKDLPSYFPKCHRSDPKLNECLLKATDQVRPYLIKGVPELNVPPIEPFTLPEVTLEQGSNLLNFKAKLNDIVITGLSNYKFSQFDFDVPKLQFNCKASISELKLAGKYDVKGTVIGAPIVGKGDFTAGIGDSNITVFQAIEIIKKKGVEFTKPIFTNSTISVGQPKAQLYGLFDNNEQLTKATNEVIQDNVDKLFEDLRPVIEKVITSLIEDLIFRVLANNVPYDKLYPK